MAANFNGTPNEPQQSPQTPPDIGRGHPEYHFVQATMELHKDLIQVKGSLDEMKTTLNGVKTKVDDLVKWKHMILGGAATIGFLLGIAGITYKVFLEKKTEAPPIIINVPPQK